MILGSSLCLSPLANTLRLNREEGAVLVPSGVHNYALAQEGSTLYVSWTQRFGREASTVLAQVDLGKSEVREVFRSEPKAGVCLSPVLSVFKGRLELAWILRHRREEGAYYQIEFLSWNESDQKSFRRESLDYGAHPGSIRLFSNSEHLFLVGVSKKREKTPGMSIRLYGKSESGWRSLPVPSGKETFYDHQPTLFYGPGHWQLGWIRDGSVCVSRSLDGLDWSEPQQLSGKGATATNFVSTADGPTLGWVEQKGRALELHLATSADGASWAHLPASDRFEGNRLRFEFGATRNALKYLIYHYWSDEDQCERVEFAIIGRDWKRIRLDESQDQACGRSLKPVVLMEDNRLYVAWQERRGRNSAIAMNYTDFPWVEWLPVYTVVASGDESNVQVAPKLVSGPQGIFLTYFTFRQSRAPIQKQVQHCDLMLQSLELGSSNN